MFFSLRIFVLFIFEFRFGHSVWRACLRYPFGNVLIAVDDFNEKRIVQNQIMMTIPRIQNRVNNLCEWISGVFGFVLYCLFVFFFFFISKCVYAKMVDAASRMRM